MLNKELFCLRSLIISQKDLFQTLDWCCKVSKNMLLNVVFSRALILQHLLSRAIVHWEATQAAVIIANDFISLR